MVTNLERLTSARPQDINEDNPLGNKGKLAEAFAGVVKLLWSNNGQARSLTETLTLALALAQTEIWYIVGSRGLVGSSSR